MPAPGALLAGRYRIVAPLGSGGMATVHRARDERLDRDVAVKILLPNHAGDPVLAGRFEREARSLAAAAHPGVVAVFDVDPGDPAAGVEPFFVMELCQGGSLADRMAGDRRLAPDDLIPIIISVTDGLAGLHARGVVHRDVKPSNIMLTTDRAKLADFGLARSDDPAEASDLTAPGTAVGTMAYLPPDVLAGGPAGPPSDIYALGVAAFAGLTGSMPRQATFRRGSRRRGIAPGAARVLGRAGARRRVRRADRRGPRRRSGEAAGCAVVRLVARRGARPLEPGATRAPVAAQRWRGSADPNATTAAVPIVAGAAELAGRGRPGDTVFAPACGRPVPMGSKHRRGGGRCRPDPRRRSQSPADASARPAPLRRRSRRARARLARPSPSPSASPSPSPSPRPPRRRFPPVRRRTGPRRARRRRRRDRGRSRLDGLKGKEANELERRARRRPLGARAGDLDGAAKAADELAEKVDDVADEIDEDAARRLRNAVTAVIDILRDR